MMNRISIQWVLALGCLISAAILVACRQAQPANQDTLTHETMKHPGIDKFFEDYEQNFNKGLAGEDVADAVIKSFADCFVESSPVGIICGTNDKALPGKIRQGFDMYRSIGTNAMNIRSKEVTVIDDLHNMVKVGWHYTATKKDKTPVTIDFDVTYLLQVKNGVRIFAYITGDEQKVLQENGLVPEK